MIACLRFISAGLKIELVNAEVLKRCLLPLLSLQLPPSPFFSYLNKAMSSLVCSMSTVPNILSSSNHLFEVPKYVASSPETRESVGVRLKDKRAHKMKSVMTVLFL